MINAYMNHGRWVADCSCNNGILVRPANREAWCSLCHTESGIRWPDDPDAIERTLSARPPLNRNWVPGETTEKLLSENIIHGTQPIDDISEVV